MKLKHFCDSPRPRIPLPVMAMSKTTNTYNRQNWEDSEFPILCQTCLGDNP